MQQTGLLAVTAMGMTMANMHLTSIKEIRHFKENISVLLISGIFVMLTASLNPHILIEIFNVNIILYVVVMLIVVRPLSIWVSTIGTELNVKRKTSCRMDCPAGNCSANCFWLFCDDFTRSWVSRYAELLTALTFALVLATVVLHGFSIGPLAKKLNLTTTDESGVLIVGGARFSAEFAKSVKETGNEVL